ncbi:MAG: HAD family hydrolase, partial [Planctomycetes bacterium]|nr:HAD family hydrolase [Planctomycetota bacterium]
MSHPAVFLDRDDTLLVDSGFIDDPDKVKLVPDAIAAVIRLHRCGYKVVVVSNQSGVARGYFDEQRLDEIHGRLQGLLERGGAKLDGIYYCPYLEGSEAKVEAYRKRSDLRKPAPGMLLLAAGERNLDLARSWMIGDAVRDIEAGHRARCRTLLLGP